MKKRRVRTYDDLRPEYDLRQLLKGGIRGKYAKRCHAGTSTEKALNDALRLVMDLRKITTPR